MMFEYNPYALAAMMTGVASLALAAVIWSRRPGRGVVPFVILVIGIAVWDMMHALELASTTLTGKIVFGTLNYPGIVVVPAAMFWFALEYTGRDQWLHRRRNQILILLIPALTLLSIATNHWHGLHWLDVSLIAGTTTADYTYGPFFWIYTAYAYVMLLISVGLLIHAFVRTPDLYRGQITAVLVAQAIPWIANAIYLFELAPDLKGLDLTAQAFALTVFIIGWSLYRYQLMDVAPIAHHIVFDSLEDPVFVFDSRQRVVDANSAALKLLGQPKERVIGQYAESVFAEESLLHEFYQADRIDKTSTREIAIRKDEQTQFFDPRLSYIRSTNGDISGRILTLYDVTALIKTNRELEAARIKADEASRIKTEFLATMSHELRTPLNIILGYTGLLTTGVVQTFSDEVQEIIKRVEDSGQQLLQIVNDVLDLARIEAGRMILRIVTCNVPELVTEWQHQLEILIGNKDVKVRVDVDPELPEMLYSDPDRLSQVVMNLIANASKFTEQGEIWLRVVLKDEQHWQIEVQDTGIGIAEADQQYIFEAFRQVDGSYTREHGGTGLGLAIVAQLTHSMQGRVAVSSEVGKGSCFVVTFPLVLTQ